MICFIRCPCVVGFVKCEIFGENGDWEKNTMMMKMKFGCLINKTRENV